MLTINVPALRVPDLYPMMQESATRLASERRNPTSGPPRLLFYRGATWVCGDSMTKSRQMLKPGQWLSAVSFIAEALPNEVAALIAVLKEASGLALFREADGTIVVKEDAEVFNIFDVENYIECGGFAIYLDESVFPKRKRPELNEKDSNEIKNMKLIYSKYIKLIEEIEDTIKINVIEGKYLIRKMNDDGSDISISSSFIRNSRLYFSYQFSLELSYGECLPNELFSESYLIRTDHFGRSFGAQMPLAFFEFCLAPNRTPQKLQERSGRPPKHDWAKAAAIMAAYMAEYGEPGAVHGDMSRAAEHLLERMGENAPSDSVAREFIASIRDEYSRIKSH